MVLQRDGGAEQRHDPVPGELVHHPVKPGHAGRAAPGQLGHHRAQPLRIQPLGQQHRTDHFGEQHRNLLALTRLDRPGAGLADPRGDC
jgi:hypothetical protein